MTPAVREAVDELIRQYGADHVLAADDPNGGACVIIEGRPLGPPFAQSDTWVGFHITHNCPYADVYPHFVRADLTRVDGGRLGEGLSGGHQFPQPAALKHGNDMPTRPAVQVSRRSNRKDTAGLETPLHKLLKVLQWLKLR